jgi:hypothetical protein
VPEPLKSLVLVLVLTPAPPAVVVVVVLLVCAKAVETAITQAMPPANIFINLVCFMFVLCFG